MALLSITAAFSTIICLHFEDLGVSAWTTTTRGSQRFPMHALIRRLFIKLLAVWCADQNSIFASLASALTSPLLCLDPGLSVAVELQSWG